jgi:protein CpxP
MKRIIYRFVYCTDASIVAVLFCMAIILASPLISGTLEARTEASGAESVEAKIDALHSKLGITEAQEEQWKKLAQVMRENATSMEQLIQARKAKGKNLNAVEDLKSYSEITDAHAAGLHKFITVFEALYASMSDDQKKTADKIFTKHSLKKLKKK